MKIIKTFLLALAVVLTTYIDGLSATPLMRIKLAPEDSIKVVESNEQMINDVIVPDSVMPQEIVPVKAALVLDDIYGKKEMEFTKGFLYGIEASNLPENSVSLKLINGEIPSDSLEMILEEFSPDIIFTTQDKECPTVLLDYVGEHNSRIVNIFDTKGDNYIASPSIIQLLIPSSKFNTSSAKYLGNQFNDYFLIIIGEPDVQDALLRELNYLWPDDRQLFLPVSDIAEYPFDSIENYAIYISSNTQSGTNEALEAVQLAKESNPVIEWVLLGRPNWIANNELFNKAIGFDAYIPVKCYFDVSSPEARKFIPEYKSRFGNAPIKSYPTFAVMGYDAATYFLPQLLFEQENPETFAWPESEGIQLKISLNNDNWFSGRYNAGSYMLHINPAGKVEKIPIKAD